MAKSQKSQKSQKEHVSDNFVHLDSFIGGKGKLFNYNVTVTDTGAIIDHEHYRKAQEEAFIAWKDEKLEYIMECWENKEEKYKGKGTWNENLYWTKSIVIFARCLWKKLELANFKESYSKYGKQLSYREQLKRYGNTEERI